MKIKRTSRYIVIHETETDGDAGYILTGGEVEKWMEDGSIVKGDRVFDITNVKEMVIATQLIIKEA